MTYPNVPTNVVIDQCGQVEYLGLTKREYFAAMAMQGLLANHLMVDTMTTQAQNTICNEAVFYADTLITVLNRQR